VVRCGRVDSGWVWFGVVGFGGVVRGRDKLLGEARCGTVRQCDVRYGSARRGEAGKGTDL